MAAAVACSRCPEPAVLRQPVSGQSLCRQHFLRSFERRAKLELAQQGRLPEGTIAVALSGGKDSVSVLHFLHGVMRDHPRVRLVAITVDEGIQGYRDSSLDICRDLTDRFGIPWHVVRTRDLAGRDVDAFAASGPADRPACGFCGVFRRQGLNEAARQVGAAAVVTGHNLDDMAQTVLMNHLKGDVDRLARLAPHADPRPGLVPRLVPFRGIPEKEVLLYAVLHDLPLHDEAECPYAARSHRFAMRDVLVALEERSPGTRHALMAGADRIKGLLGAAPGPESVGACVECGGPTSGTMCKACQYRTADGARAQGAVGMGPGRVP